MSLRMWGQYVLVAAALMATAGPVRAAEQVTLRNGFEITCHHHAVTADRVRLYTGKTNENYIEVAPGDIASVTRVPDPPPRPEPPVATALPAPEPAKNPSQATAVLTPEDLNEMLAKAGDEHNLDRDLLASVVKAESKGNARAVSRTGARGLMQLMPATAADLGVEDTFGPNKMSAADRPTWTRCSPDTTTTWPWRWLPTMPDRRGGQIPRHPALSRDPPLRCARIHEFNRRVRRGRRSRTSRSRLP